MQPIRNSARVSLLAASKPRLYFCPRSSCWLPIAQLKAPSPSKPLLQQYSTKRHSTSLPSKSRVIPRLLILGLALGGTVYYFSIPSRNTTLNDRTFVPYTVTSREPISPTSFILTVSPHDPHPSPPYLIPSTSAWRHSHWSVEFKQPEVQIARHYTPLPPRAGEDSAGGSLHFYIRTVGDGEMSRYLGRLSPGRDVWLRGPHAGFDMVEKLGERKDVVFLAGGTGVAPAMQAAHTILNNTSDVTFSLLWAVRKREELQNAVPTPRPWWDLWSETAPVALDTDLEAPSSIVRDLKAMKAQYGDRLRIQVAIDQEGSFFREKDIQNALLRSPTGVLGLSGSGCSYHDPELHKAAYEFKAPEHGCQCDVSSGAPRGKNLFVVTGPEGFITHFAGCKVWRGGFETQGPVGEVAERILRQNPQLASEWLVLKL